TVPQFVNFYTPGAVTNFIPSGQAGSSRYPLVHAGVWSAGSNLLGAGAFPNQPGFWTSVVGVTTLNNATSLTSSNRATQMGESTFVFDGTDQTGSQQVVHDAAGNPVNGMLLAHQGRVVI